MPLLWTAPSDIRDRWLGDEPLDATDAQLTTLLEDAEDTILRAFPDIQERIGDAPGELPELRVKKVAARVVIRHLRNPKGLRSVQETAGPYQEGRTVVQGGNEPGAMYLTDDERAELSEARVGKAFTINQTPQGYYEPRAEIAPDSWYGI